MIEHEGSSVNPDRQEVSHPHMIVTTPDNRFAVVPDLGTDKIYLYDLDTAAGTLSLSQTLESTRRRRTAPRRLPSYVAAHVRYQRTRFHAGDFQL